MLVGTTVAPTAEAAGVSRSMASLVGGAILTFSVLASGVPVALAHSALSTGLALGARRDSSSSNRSLLTRLARRSRRGDCRRESNENISASLLKYDERRVLFGMAAHDGIVPVWASIYVGPITAATFFCDFDDHASGSSG